MYKNSGTIDHVHHGTYYVAEKRMVWNVFTNCTTVRVDATQFDINENGFIRIGSLICVHEECDVTWGERYDQWSTTGKLEVVNSNNFRVNYVANNYGKPSRFKLNWKCYEQTLLDKVVKFFDRDVQKYGVALALGLFILVVLLRWYCNFRSGTNRTTTLVPATEPTNPVSEHIEHLPLTVVAVPNVQPQFNGNNPAYIAPPTYEDAPPAYEDAMSKPSFNQKHL